jgi:phosphoglycerate dehydrogenase-like enzyme
LRPRVLLVEAIHPDAMGWLRGHADVVVAPDHRGETLGPLVHEIDGLVIRAGGRVDDALLAQAPRLRVVARHGVGLDNVDVDACSRRGIWVVSTPLAPLEAVAEHAVALMLAVAKGLLRSDQAVRAGEFSAVRGAALAQELRGRTLGIVGFGRIGRRVAEICHGAFGMPVLFADILPRQEAAHPVNATRVSLGELLDRSDVISLHVPLTPQTHHLLDAAALARLRPGAILVNTSRGAVIDEAALIAALRDGRLSAGLDVFEEEPLPAGHPLTTLPNVVLTPHTASHTEAALRAMGMVVEDVVRVLRGEPPRYPANTPVAAGRDTSDKPRGPGAQGGRSAPGPRGGERP